MPITGKHVPHIAVFCMKKNITYEGKTRRNVLNVDRNTLNIFHHSAWLIPFRVVYINLVHVRKTNGQSFNTVVQLYTPPKLSIYIKLLLENCIRYLFTRHECPNPSVAQLINNYSSHSLRSISTATTVEVCYL